MFDTNPNLIQEPPPPHHPTTPSPWGPRKPSPPTPLILIHDGGGTIFSYYCLGELARPLWGIANPLYHSPTATWAGGLPEMASSYLEFIKTAVPCGKLIIGGWSLGGMLSLEISKQMAADPATYPYDLLGIIMVDSVCPLVFTHPILPTVQHALTWGPNTKEETKAKVLRCFSESSRMVKEWKLPEWEEGKMKPPPVILLRAKEPVPVPDGGLSRVDVQRHDRHLGWDSYRKDLITKVVDIPGHHFNIFSNNDNLDVATEEIRKACLELEGRANGTANGNRRFFA